MAYTNLNLGQSNYGWGDQEWAKYIGGGRPALGGIYSGPVEMPSMQTKPNPLMPAGYKQMDPVTLPDRTGMTNTAPSVLPPSYGGTGLYQGPPLPAQASGLGYGGPTTNAPMQQPNWITNAGGFRGGPVDPNVAKVQEMMRGAPMAPVAAPMQQPSNWITNAGGFRGGPVDPNVALVQEMMRKAGINGS